MGETRAPKQKPPSQTANIISKREEHHEENAFFFIFFSNDRRENTRERKCANKSCSKLPWYTHLGCF